MWNGYNSTQPDLHKVTGLNASLLPNHTITEILNYHPISPLIGTAGQPTGDQLAALYQAGYDVVINLATPASSNAQSDEASLVTALGLTYVPIPVVWQRPTLEDLSAFFVALDTLLDRKLFIHCALNYRVSTFMYLYRVIRLGVPHETAVWEMLSIWEPDEIWSQFIADAFEFYGLERPLSS